MSKEWSVTLNTGAKIPAFGLGTWMSQPGEVGAAVEAALKAGYKHIDCAHIYGNEVEIGQSLQKCFKEGVVKREDIFITSKLWNTEHAFEDVEPACALTLKNLQLDYLDLYLIHWPQMLKKGCSVMNLSDDEKLGYDADRFAKTWEGMEGVAEKGLAKAIGISNCTITKTENLLKTAKIVPAVNQVECHPYFQQQKLKEYCDSKGITFEAYSPLGNPGRPMKGEDDPNPLEDPVIAEIAKKHGVTPAQICLSFALHRGLVVLAKSVKPSRIEENLKATQVELDSEDMRQLRGLDKNLRFLRFFMMKEGLTAEEFWDVKGDEAFTVKQPEEKRQKTED